MKTSRSARVGDDVRLTEEGWLRLRNELKGLEEQLDLDLQGLRETRETARSAEETEAVIAEIDSLRGKIDELNQMLSRAVVVGETDRDSRVVGIGSSVRVLWDDGREGAYTIVGPPEIDVSLGRISYDSPVGKALVGLQVGAWVDVDTPAGCRKLTVMSLT